MRLLFLLLIASTLGLPAAGAASGRVVLKEAGPREVAAALSEATGVPVQVRGGVGRRINLDVDPGRPATAVARAAAALHGDYVTLLRVRPRQPNLPDALLPVDQEITTGFVDLPVRRGYEWVARQLGFRLDWAAPDEVRISLVVSGLSAAALLNRLASESDTQWDITYLIEAPDQPPPPPPVRVAPLSSPADPMRDRSQIPAPVAPPGEALPEPAAIKAALHDAMLRLLTAAPAERGASAAEMVRYLDTLGLTLSRVGSTGRSSHIAALRPLFAAWRQFYNGLAPQTQGQLIDVAAAFGRVERIR